MSGQSKTASIVESLTNTMSGYLLAIVTQSVIYPAFGIEMDLHRQALIALCFSSVSIIRGYLFRRLFNFLHVRGILQ